MLNLSNKIKILRGVNTSLDTIIRKAVESSEDAYIDFVKNKQMYELGIDGNGESLGQYSPLSVSIKKSKGQRYDHITLLDTGEFYEKIKFSVSDSFFEVDSSGRIKEDGDILDRWSEDVFKLTEENKEKWIKNFLNPIIKKEIKKCLH